MYIGPYKIEKKALLAPMAGITDKPFREICLDFGAGLTYSEMLLANRETWYSPQSRLKFLNSKNIAINAVQILGAEPNVMADTAKFCVDNGAQIIDINMGCPAKKINHKKAGSSLLKDPELVTAIIKKVVTAVSVPVTLKIRTGWDMQHRNYALIAKIAEEEGIKALTIHGRTKSCLFKGVAEYESIKEVKSFIRIPVIANGDIKTATDAKLVLSYTGADAVMIGRGALGCPWLFSEINNDLSVTTSNSKTKTLNTKEKLTVIFEHIKQIHILYGAEKGVFIARKHVHWYLDRLQPNNIEFRRNFNSILDANEQLRALKSILRHV